MAAAEGPGEIGTNFGTRRPQAADGTRSSGPLRHDARGGNCQSGRRGGLQCQARDRRRCKNSRKPTAEPPVRDAAMQAMAKLKKARASRPFRLVLLKHPHHPDRRAAVGLAVFETANLADPDLIDLRLIGRRNGNFQRFQRTPPLGLDARSCRKHRLRVGARPEERRA